MDPVLAARLKRAKETGRKGGLKSKAKREAAREIPNKREPRDWLDDQEELEQAFNVFAAKAPVDHPGPQRKADAAWRVLSPHLTVTEAGKIGTALSHALHTREGRGEFDRVIRGVRARLLPSP